MASLVKLKKASGMELNLVIEGLKFMVLGMSTVFLFLMLMVWVLRVQSTIISKFFPSEKAPSSTATSSTLSSPTTQNTSHIVAIVAAIQMYRQQCDQY